MPDYLTKRKQITAARTWQLRKVTLFSNASERDRKTGVFVALVEKTMVILDFSRCASAFDVFVLMGDKDHLVKKKKYT